MKRQLVFFVLAISWCSYGQQTEFKVYDNGLIYSEASMNKLGTIVDSLNLKFRTCDLTHPYYSFAQGMATKVNVRNKEALKLIESGVSFEAFKQRYPGSIEEEMQRKMQLTWRTTLLKNAVFILGHPLDPRP